MPVGRKGKIDLKGFAALLAPLCRMLRDDVAGALQDPHSPLVELAREWRQSLFPDASDGQLADAYAQTVAFALLLGRGGGADPLTLASAQATLSARHSLLSRALHALTDASARARMAASLDSLLRLIAAVPLASLAGPVDPWLHFYEDFLAAYDPKLRRDAGVYYTPIEVVRAQVRLIDDLLVNSLGRPRGFTDPGVIVLDPAAGTGTYLLGVIEHALGRVVAEQGSEAVPGQATALAANLYGFEPMAGPYAVAELRISRALRDRGAALPNAGTHIYLTDTLGSPNRQPAEAPAAGRDGSVLVCLGNPPYDRHRAARGDNQARTGGWVRWGDGEASQAPPIFQQFVGPAIAAGHGGDLKNLYNLYVYFWRWALWRVFERERAGGPGIVSFISASSYLDGDAFGGMREHMRRLADEIWILDLGGEGRGPRKSGNVFAIRTPVAIAVAVRTGKPRNGRPAAVRYSRIEGTREAKLAALGAIADFASVKWQACPDDWQAPFRPAGKGAYFAWPLLTDLMPWQHSGVQLKRTWPLAPDLQTLERRWRGLLSAKDRSQAFHGTGDRDVHGTYPVALGAEADSKPLAHLPEDAPMPPAIRYAYRSFDLQTLIADGRLISRPRPGLWRAHGERQLYLTSLFSQPLGGGPALTSCAAIPDLDYFRGSYGAKAAIPLYRNAGATEANTLPGLLGVLGEAYQRQVTPEDFLAYVYGALAQPAFTALYAEELETRELRVPITRDAALFGQVRDAGARLLWLHTYGERFVPEGKRPGQVPRGAAKCTKPVLGGRNGYPASFAYDEAARTLRVGGGEFRPVAPEVFAFEVSGLKVVNSWLKYRMRKGAGRKSSPLDGIRPERWPGQFTTELLELLWVLEATAAGYPGQAKLLQAVVAGRCFRAGELPPVPSEARQPSPVRRARPSRSLLLN